MVYVIQFCRQLAIRIRMEFILGGNSTCFGQFLCPSSGVFHCTHSSGICHTVLQAACEQDQDGILILLASCLQNCMTYTTAVCTVKKSRRWTEELSETCRVSSQNKFHPDPARKLSAELYEIYHCCVYSEKLPMMERGTVRNMLSFLPK